jgi:hypothetical protein
MPVMYGISRISSGKREYLTVHIFDIPEWLTLSTKTAMGCISGISSGKRE